MKNRILIIAATDLSDNNSASLCHTAYIRGFVDSGYEVHVLTVKPCSESIDFKIIGANYCFISDENFIIKLVRNIRKKNNNTSVGITNNTSKKNIKSIIMKKIVDWIGATQTLKKRAYRFRLEISFDLVLSLSSPPTSHEIANILKSNGSVHGKHWCQLWEDPWSTDLYQIDESVKDIEHQLLSSAERILYVSPLTLERQKKIFSDCANKMDWLPLPTYYDEDDTFKEENKVQFGYFGQYYPQVRNLEPLYSVLKKEELPFIICGEPHELFEAVDKIEIYPRVNLQKLAVFEERANVLVVIANLGGGQIPGKIYQYSGTNKTILFVIDGNDHEKEILKEYFSKFNRYIFAENDEKSIMKAIEYIMNEKEYNKKKQPVEYFKASNIAEQIIIKCVKN